MDSFSLPSSFDFAPPSLVSINSVRPTIFKPTSLSLPLARDKDLEEASRIYSLQRVDIMRVPEPFYYPVLLGAGASYRVYAAKLPQLPELVAIKFIKSKTSPDRTTHGPSLAEQKATLVKEMHALGQFQDHPNIVRLLGWGRPDGPVSSYDTGYLVTEYTPLGSLDTYLEDKQNRFSDEEGVAVCLGVAEGLRALHSQSVIHGDVKTANILLFPGTSSRRFVAKISDLGMAFHLNIDANKSYHGTYRFSAPEVRNPKPRLLQDLDYRACDIYSYGLLVWTVFKGRPSYLQGLKVSHSGRQTEEELLDLLGPDRLLQEAKNFAKSGDRDRAFLLRTIFDGCLSVDAASRQSARCGTFADYLNRSENCFTDRPMCLISWLECSMYDMPSTLQQGNDSNRCYMWSLILIKCPICHTH